GVYRVEINFVVGVLEKTLQRLSILLLIYQQLFPGVETSLDDVELASTGFFLGVHCVAESCCGESTPFVEELCIELGRNRVAGTSIAQRLAGTCLPGIGVTSLNHESLNDPVKQQAVVIAFT